MNTYAVICPLTVLLLLAEVALSQPNAPSGFEELLVRGQPGQMYEKQGAVRFKPAVGSETNAAVPQPVGFDETLRTLELSGAAMRLTDQTYLRLWQLTRLQILRLPLATNAPTIKIYQGQIRATSRARVTGIPIEGLHGARGIPHGTEFVVSVDADSGTTKFTMFDGRVEMSNDVDTRLITRGQQGIAEPGQPIRVVPILQATNIIQWWIYYPGVLDLDELQLTPAAQSNLSASLDAYRAGSPAQALETFPGYPHPQEPATDTERAYLAALLLSVGAVDKAQAQLALADSNAAPVRAMRIIINAVTQDFISNTSSNQHTPKRFEPSDAATASEALALSYQYQAVHNLESALAAARESVHRSTNFGFGWSRVAELEFGFGRISAARKAVERSLKLSFRNAHAHTVNGFLLAAENHIKAAMAEFNTAIDLDPSLGDAWLGRGLCKIHLGSLSPLSVFRSPIPPSALEDLEAAAALEPQRSLLRSYAGKAFAEARDTRLAQKELDFARQLDPNDPTPWLYSALLNQQQNRVNEAVSDLEQSQGLNNNRGLFRSRLLLDQDRAVRSADLAAIYRDAGLFDVSVHEASRAVTSDYANSGAHLFLANSYTAWLDPRRVSLRYETFTLAESLLANLLAPSGAAVLSQGGGQLSQGSAFFAKPAGPLSQNVSEQEYSRLLEREGLHISSQTEYLSNGDWRQNASQFGAYGNMSYAVDAGYRSDAGRRPNNDLEQLTLSAKIKQQVTLQDSVYLEAAYSEFNSGDLAQYYDPQNSSPDFRVNDRQNVPNLFLGWHHEWAPGNHALLLVGRLNDSLTAVNPDTAYLGVVKDNGQIVDTVDSICERFGVPGPFCSLFDLAYRSRFDLYSIDLQQICETERQVVVIGSRYQTGQVETKSRVVREAGRFPPFCSGFGDCVYEQMNSTYLQRISGYGYYSRELLGSIWLTGGIGYDALVYPENIQFPPISGRQAEKDLISPKVGFIWQPKDFVSVRGAYTRSLGGLFYDQSVRLEPTQVGGFNQAWRSVAPESIRATAPGSQFETCGVGVNWRILAGAYVGVDAEILRSKARRSVGVFDFDPTGARDAIVSQTPETLDYEEKSVVANFNQLIGKEWSLGARYKISEAALDSRFPEIPVGLTAYGRSNNHGLLHQLDLFALYNSERGFFARSDSIWYHQSNHGYSPNLPGDDFWQFNVYAGYRFPRRNAEVTVGLLNITDQDYRLNPLNLYPDLARDRMLTVTFKFNL